MDGKNDGLLEGNEEESREVFRRELDKWFREKGVMAELRSHLRHSMVMALQSGDAGRVSKDAASPKGRALDLLVADFLFCRGCHYALSVLASEVSGLATFSTRFPIGRSQRRHGPTNGKGRRTSEPAGGQRNFQEKEVEEILNALGLCSCPLECSRLTKRYLEEEPKDNSLLDLILQWTVEVATITSISRNLESFSEGEGQGEPLLSPRWTRQVVDILAKERINGFRADSICKSIYRVTEAELKRIKEEERKGTVQILAERERRIQDLLLQYEKEIRVKLGEAEKQLLDRKDLIERDLSQRQKHLSKMILDWNAKHEEIIQLARSVYKVQKNKTEMDEENEKLRERIQHLSEQVSMLKGQENRLREENEVLKGRLDRQTGNGPLEESLVDLEPSKEALNMGNDVKRRESGSNDGKDEGDQTDPFKYGSRCDDGDDDEEISRSSTPLNYRNKLKDLEEKARLINCSFLKYKSKYQNICLSDTEGDSSNNSSKDSKAGGDFNNPIAVYKATKYSQTEKQKEISHSRECRCERETKRHQVNHTEIIPKMEDSLEKRCGIPRIKSRTESQLIDREYYLESRKLLEELENEIKKKHEEKPRRNSSASLSNENHDCYSSGGSCGVTVDSTTSGPLPSTERNDNDTEMMKKNDGKTVENVAS